MDMYKETLHNLSWQELLTQLSTILARDAKALESNVNYYKKLFNDSNADKAQLNKLFDRLQLDKIRYAYFSELFIRLDEDKYKFIIMYLESCIQQEHAIQNKYPKDWSATVNFKDGEVTVYFMPLSYYQ